MRTEGMMALLRQEVRREWDPLSLPRPPALRQARPPDVLLATDLPLLTGEAESLRFIEGLRASGWLVREENGWLLLDRALPEPLHRLTPEEGEAACLHSLLSRHPDGLQDEAAARALAKAAELGPQQLQNLCGLLHRQMAVRLREHKPLPGRLIPCLEGAYWEGYAC